MKTIKGIEILTQKLVYGFQPLWLIIGILGITIGILTFARSLEVNSGANKFISLGIAIAATIILYMSGYAPNKNYFNTEKSIQYTIEILDDNAWKELGPRYKVLEKVYDNKEIYIIEEDLTSNEN